MFNLLKFETKKALYSKSTYIIVAVGIFMLASLLALSSGIRNDKDIYIDEYISNNRDKIDQSIIEEYYEKGIRSGSDEIVEKLNVTDEDLKKDYNFHTYAFEKNLSSMNAGGSLLLLIPIFTALFAVREHSTGYIKNLIGIKGYKKYGVLAKFIVTAIYTLIYITIFTGLNYLISLYFGGNTSFDTDKLVKLIIGLLVGLSAINSVIILISHLFQKSTSTIVFTLLYTSNIITSIFGLVNLLKLGFDINDYLLMSRFSKFRVFGSRFQDSINYIENFNNLIYVAIPFLIVSLIIATFLLNKKDIKTGE